MIERRRKELLQHLLELQGEPASRGTPKSLEEVAVEKEKEKETKIEKAESVEKDKSEEPRSPTKRLEKRNSKIVSGLVGNFETLQKTAKEEELAETPKRWVTLKKVAKPQDFPDTEKKEEEENKDEQAKESEVEIKEPTPVPDEEVPDKGEGTPKVTLRQTDNNELKPERPSSAASIESHELSNAGEEEEEKGGKKKKKNKRGIFKSRGKRDKSPAPAAAETTANGEEAEGEKNGVSEGEKAEEQPPAPQEEGVKLVMTLERKSKSKFGHKWIKQEVKLKESTLYAGDKEMDLSGCVVFPTDTGFEISHPEQKNLIFKVEGDELKDQWVTALNETIKECTPEEEKGEYDCVCMCMHVFIPQAKYITSICLPLLFCVI